MKITFVLPFAGVTGGNRVIATYAEKFMARGHDVFVISHPHPTYSTSWHRRIRIALGLARAPLKKETAPWFDALGSRHIVYAHQGAPRPEDVPDGDVIIATWWETAEWVAAMPASKGRKFHLLQGYEMFPNLPPDRVAASFQLPLQKIAVSEWVRAQVSQNHGIDDIEVVMNGVDPNLFNAPPRTRNTSLRVGFLNTPVTVKNVGRAVEALSRAKTRLPQLEALSFGASPNPSLDPIRDWLDLHVTPAQEDIPALYAACDFWLFTSDSEGFGLPILEAMACRTPVLATSAGAAPDIINGQNGLLLPHDADAFAEAIYRLAQLPEEKWREMSEAARATALAQSWDTATDKFLEILAADKSPGT